MSLDEALQRSVDSALPGDGVSGALLFKFTPNALSPLASSWFLLAALKVFKTSLLDYTEPPRGVHVMPESPEASLGPGRPATDVPWTWLPILTP